jgi:hypothetical protein
MSMIVNMPIGGYPLAMYGMIALTTGILAYATISSGSGSAEESTTGSADGKSMLSGLFGSSEPKDESEVGIINSLGDMMSSTKESDPLSTTKPINGGGSRRRKNRKTKNKRRKNRSEKRKA